MKHHNASDFEKIVQKMLEVHKAKNNDYSPEGQFGNFAESERIGVPDWKGAFIRLQDKYTRCCNLIGGREAQVLDEKLEDTLLDLANYAVIVLCLMKGKNNQLTSGGQNETSNLNIGNGDYSERTAARNVEDTVRFRQSKDEYLNTASEILNTPPRPEMEAHPRLSLADLVDWERAPDFAQWAAQDNTGEIFWYEREPYLDGDRKKWLNMFCQCTFFDERPLAHDWQTPLKRPNSNQGCSSEHKHQSFTDEEPGYLYRHIPVTEQEDKEWESKAPSDVPPLARRYDPKHG